MTFAQTARGRPKVALVLDPRFPGGTSSAVAQEIPVIAPFCDLQVHGISSAMFSGTAAAPTLGRAISAQGLTIEWDTPIISADVIILHNPSFLKFDASLASRLVCQALIVVTHENFLAPDGQPGFDVDGCLARIEEAALCARAYLAPVSPYNRTTVETWLETQESDWQLAQSDWFNICDFTLLPPHPAPRDRRGRHSRPGPEKFPNAAAMAQLFSERAESNALLGADNQQGLAGLEHVSMHPFGTMDVAEFLHSIDFFVYFTNPGWRESFGRAIAEAIAAGKLVLTDPETAAVFGKGVVGCAPSEVDGLIAGYLAAPETYVRDVLEAQSGLERFSAGRFATQFTGLISDIMIERAGAAT